MSDFENLLEKVEKALEKDEDKVINLCIYQLWLNTPNSPYAPTVCTKNHLFLLLSIIRQDALRDVEAAIELEPASAKAWFMKGRALFGLDDFTGAIDAVKKAIDNGIAGW